MKKLLLLLLFVTGVVNAQIVNIPDAAFKAKLLSADVSNTIAGSGVVSLVSNSYVPTSYIKIDANNDNEIQVSEALAVTYLDVSGNFGINGDISNLIGIEAFINLQSLNCSYNQVTSLDVTQNVNLLNLNCGNNQLTSLDVLNNTSIIELHCDYNQLSSIELNTDLGLEKLHCDSNQIANLVLSNNTSLKELFCQDNQLETLNLNYNNQLQTLRCENNQLTSLLVNSVFLSVLECYDNQITSLDVSSLINLEFFQCYNNQLTSLDVSNNVLLQRLECSSNQLTTLDVNNNIHLYELFCDVNPLVTLFIKNGITSIFNLDISISTLQYVCGDETDVENYLNSGLPHNFEINSYCTFSPGGEYNSVSGTVRFDADNNGCDNNDSSFPNMVNIAITNNSVSSNTTPTSAGNYILYTSTESSTLTPSLENPNYFTISPTSATFDFSTLGNTQNQDFCITANGVHNDLEVVISPFTTARPGFDAIYKIVCKNKGNQTLSGNVNFVYIDAVLDYVTATINPDVQTTGELTWNYSNLKPFESRSFNVVLNVNSPTETPAINIGDSLGFSASIEPISNDEEPSDNNFAFKQIVVGSFDPNDKVCLDGDIVSSTKIGDYLYYTINFENTGNAAAENIVVKDSIDIDKFDISTLQIMNSSHAMTTKMSGNKVEFVFQNINLGASQHGNVTFKIKTLSSLAVGSSVTNKADIYFDYNFPVATNTATTTFQTLSSGEFTLDNSVKVYPNPAKNNININCNSTIKSIELFDMQGRILTTKIVDDSESNFDISNYSNGVYFVKITTEKGSKVEKIIKE